MKTNAYAAQSATTPLAPFSYSAPRSRPARRANPDSFLRRLPHGRAHRPQRMARHHLPVRPGHEIIGRVTKIGAHVKKFKEGDLAGVGCMVDSCRICENCKDDLEQFCDQGATFTYNAPDKHSGGMTYGGYSESVVVDEAFVLHVPKNLDLAATAPLLCAGHHHLFAFAPLQSRQRPKGRHRRTRRAWAHGRETGQGFRRARRGLHHSPGKVQGCLAARRG